MNLIIVSASNISIDHFIRPVQKAINWAAIHSICLLVGEAIWDCQSAIPNPFG
jgi:hypothetical protein